MSRGPRRLAANSRRTFLDRFIFNAVIPLLLLLLSTACRTKPLRFYPIGIYGVPSTNDLVTVRKAGFNLVSGPAREDYLDAAASLGLGVMASPGTSAGPVFNSMTARSVVHQFDSHPALWAWYLVDEPDMNRVPPEQVTNANRFIKNLPARKPTTLVIYHGYTSIDYANITDITMIDHYPIPWLPLANFPQHLRMTRLSLGKKKPMIAVLQAFDWSAYPEQLPGETNLRPPTHAEMRCMAYCALAQRANGLFFYAFEGGDWKIQEHPEVWEDLKKVVSEVRHYLPLFEAEHIWWPSHSHYGDSSKRFNSALDASISVSLLRVEKGNPFVIPGDYVLGVNTTDQSHVYSFTVPHLSLSAVSVLGEDRLIAILNTWIEDEFEPYAVHIYGPLPLSYSPDPN